MQFDAFVSHASEDKPYVEALVRGLEAVGIRVWYDRTTLEWGDDLRRSIDQGLLKSRFGIVIFSPAFLKRKKWTEYELDALFSREGPQEKIVLPIWHNITRDDLAQYSPAFADRLSKNSQGDSIDEIAKSLLSLLNDKNTYNNRTTESKGKFDLAEQFYIMSHGNHIPSHEIISFSASILELIHMECVEFCDKFISIKNTPETSDMILNRVYIDMSKMHLKGKIEPHSISNYFGSSDFNRLNKLLLEQLSLKGAIKETKTHSFWVFDIIEHKLNSTQLKDLIKSEIRNEILGIKKVTSRTRDIISLCGQFLPAILSENPSEIERTSLTLGILKIIEAWPSRHDDVVRYLLAQEPTGSMAGAG